MPVDKENASETRYSTTYSFYKEELSSCLLDVMQGWDPQQSPLNANMGQNHLKGKDSEVTQSKSTANGTT